MFALPVGGTNWCFFEWSKFSARFSKSELERNMLFVVAAADPGRLDDFFADYKKWHDHVVLKDPPYLPEVAFSSDEASVRQIKRIIEEKLAGQIRCAWAH